MRKGWGVCSWSEDLLLPTQTRSLPIYRKFAFLFLRLGAGDAGNPEMPAAETKKAPKSPLSRQRTKKGTAIKAENSW